jgi:hypothetical protein
MTPVSAVSESAAVETALDFDPVVIVLAGVAGGGI